MRTLSALTERFLFITSFKTEICCRLKAINLRFVLLANHRPNAMDLILAINQRTPVTRKFHVARQQMGEEIVKRMNVTKFSNGTMVITNTSEVLNGTDIMLQVNLGTNMS